MKNTFSYIILACIVILTTSCTKDEIENNDPSVVGVWKLTDYDMGISFDIDNDRIKSFNIIDEIDCEVNEELVFKLNGTMASNDTFHHIIEVSKLELSGDYVFDIECSEGYISFASPYIQENSTIVEFNNRTCTINGNQLTAVFENAIEIYNEDFTEIIEVKDLIKVYTKQ